MREALLKKLLAGETLEGEEALEAFQGLGWRAGVQMALALLQDGKIEEAKAILESLLEEDAEPTDIDLSST